MCLFSIRFVTYSSFGFALTVNLVRSMHGKALLSSAHTRGLIKVDVVRGAGDTLWRLHGGIACHVTRECKVLSTCSASGVRVFQNHLFSLRNVKGPNQC